MSDPVEKTKQVKHSRLINLRDRIAEITEGLNTANDMVREHSGDLVGPTPPTPGADLVEVSVDEPLLGQLENKVEYLSSACINLRAEIQSLVDNV